MNDSKISVRYARALFESASDQGILDEVRKDMLQLQEICRMKKFDFFLRTPVMKGSEKSRLVHDSFKGILQELSLNLLDLVLKNNRELYIPGIARNFEELYKKHKTGAAKIEHMKHVTKLSLIVAEMLKIPVNKELLKYSALIHDLPIPYYYDYSKPLSDFDYLWGHQVKVREILIQEGYPEIAEIAARHNAHGLTIEEAKRFNVDIPVDLTPEKVESKIIAFVDGLRKKFL